MPQLLSTTVSVLALAISVATGWFTLRGGTIRMTQPTTIYFGADASASPSPNVYIRTLLYTTAKRGKIIEGMFVKLRCGESIQTFNIWVYGEDSLALGRCLRIYKRKCDPGTPCPQTQPEPSRAPDGGPLSIPIPSLSPRQASGVLLYCV